MCKVDHDVHFECLARIRQLEEGNKIQWSLKGHLA